MAAIAIVYHSVSGHTRKLAEAVWRGASAAGAAVTLVAVEERSAPEEVNRSGAFLGAMGSSFSAPPDVSPSVGDLRTGELLGERVATLTARFLGR